MEADLSPVLIREATRISQGYLVDHHTTNAVDPATNTTELTYVDERD